MPEPAAVPESTSPQYAPCLFEAWQNEFKANFEKEHGRPMTNLELWIAGQGYNAGKNRPDLMHIPAASPVAGVSTDDLVDIGRLRRELFVNYDSEWNGWVRDTTAAIETEGGVSRSQMTRKIADYGALLLYNNAFMQARLRAQPSAEGDGWIAAHNPTNKGDQMKTEVETVTDLLDRFVEVYGEVPLRGSMQEPGMQLWRDYYAWTGDHMILSDEGWEPGEVKQSYLNEYGPDAILDEVNAPLPAPVAKEGRESCS
jgi:hypothetical protein